MNMYEVTTEGDCEGRSRRTIGYATGDPEDTNTRLKDVKKKLGR